jgi:hypothetical protein
MDSYGNFEECQRTQGHVGRCSPNYYGAAHDSIGQRAPRRVKPEDKPRNSVSILRRMVESGELQPGEPVHARELLRACNVPMRQPVVDKFTRDIASARLARYDRRADVYIIEGKPRE